MNISNLKNKHYDKPAFCLGTAPHLNQLDLTLLKDHVTIGCNQLALNADDYNLDYICFQRQERFEQVKDRLSQTKCPKFIVPNNIAANRSYTKLMDTLADRVCPICLRFTSPEHSEFFSFDLENCVYAVDSVAIEIQLAVWMGCNPIYIIGVDAQYTDPSSLFYDRSSDNKTDTERVQQHVFPDLRQWIKLTKTLLWSRKVKLYNGSGQLSSLDILPKVRLRAAAKEPWIAVTSKTFSQDHYLVNELKRYVRHVKLNDTKDNLCGKALIDFLGDADGIILGTEPFDAETMAALPCLRFVSKYGVGLNNIDFEAAKMNEIEISYRKGVNSGSVAELTLAFALSLIRCVDQSMSGYRSGVWKKLPGRELAEITLGIIGYGHVGKVVAQKFAALGVGRLLANDLIDFPNNPPVEFVPLDYLLKESDIVTIHVSMEKQNYHLINRDFIAKMKESAFLINTSRGEVVDEEALVATLRSGHMAGAALDVYESEPEINKDLTLCRNLLTTCHIAGTSNRAIKNMGWAAIEGLLGLFDMSPY